MVEKWAQWKVAVKAAPMVVDWVYFLAGCLVVATVNVKAVMMVKHLAERWV